MADTNINLNKLDDQIMLPMQRVEMPDGSVLLLQYEEKGENGVVMEKSNYWGSDYLLTMKTKKVTLKRFISIRRTSTNNYFLMACEVGQKTVGGNLRSMTEVNEYLRENFMARLV